MNNPEVKFTTTSLEFIHNEIKKKETRLLLFNTRMNSLQTYNQADLLYPLDKLLSKQRLEFYAPQALEVCRYNDSIIALPEDVSPYCLITRKDILAEYKLKPLQTWFELEEQIEWLNKKK